MNYFCETCRFKDVPESIKKKFNKAYKPTFIDCPTSDQKIAGCLISTNFDVDWNSFCNWLEDHGDLSPKEKIVMMKIGLYKREVKTKGD